MNNELLIQLKLAALTHAGGVLEQAKTLYDWLIKTNIDLEIERRKAQEAAKLAD